MGQVSSSILPEFALLQQALKIFPPLMAFGKSSTAKFNSLTSTLVCEADLDELSHGLASTELACCMVVVQHKSFKCAYIQKAKINLKEKYLKDLFLRILVPVMLKVLGKHQFLLE